jgi:type VI secretion system secreted protein VgrG
VGPAGEEIYTDEGGRVKVRFHWDREATGGADSSCWVRVASFWAGSGWGAIHIPRVGQEVIVDFLEGDPDCPIVVGSVYNAQNPCPYELPANKTQSGILSRSSKGGSPANYNEIRLEDKKGGEEILIHAEKNLTTEVESDENRSVGHDRVTSVKNDETTKVAQKQSLTVGSDRSATITGSDMTTVGQSQMVNVGGSRTVKVQGQDAKIAQSSRSATVTGSDTLTVGGSISITASGVTISAATITLNAAVVKVTGIVQCTNMVASIGVVSPAYSPGAGNIF